MNKYFLYSDLYKLYLFDKHMKPYIAVWKELFHSWHIYEIIVFGLIIWNYQPYDGTYNFWSRKRLGTQKINHKFKLLTSCFRPISWHEFSFFLSCKYILLPNIYFLLTKICIEWIFFLSFSSSLCVHNIKNVVLL